MGIVNKFRAIACALLALLPAALTAQTKDENGLFSLTAGVATNYVYNLEASAYYCPVPWVGVGVGIGFVKQGRDQAPWPHGYKWEIDDDSRSMENFYLRPSLLFTSPRLFRIKACSFRLFAEPGLVMKIPYSYVDISDDRELDQSPKYGPIVREYRYRGRSSKGAWCFWSLRAGIRINVDDGLTIGLGYGMGNFDMYSQRRNIVVNGHRMSDFYKDQGMNHTLFVSLSNAI